MSLPHRIDVHQHLVPPFWSKDLERHGGDPSGWDSPLWSPEDAIILWFIVPLGLPLWLLNIAAIGVPLLITWMVVGATGILGSVRWRRQYELSVDRLIRQFGRSEYSTPSV
jgi:hypothetical protein